MQLLGADNARTYAGREVIIIFTNEGKVTSSSYGTIETDSFDVFIETTESQIFWFINGEEVDRTLFFIPVSQIKIPA